MAASARVPRTFWSEPETVYLVGLAAAGLGLWEIGRRMVEAGFADRGRLRWYYKLRGQGQYGKHLIDEGEPLHPEDRAKLLQCHAEDRTDQKTGSVLVRSTREVRSLVAAEGLPPMRTGAKQIAGGRVKVDDLVPASKAKAADLPQAALGSRMSTWGRDPAAAQRRRINGERVRQAQEARASRSRPYRPQVSEADLRDALARAALASALGARRS